MSDKLNNIEFKSWGGEKMKNLDSYLREYLIKNPNSKIYIGTDSEQKRDSTSYITAICLYDENKKDGAHIIRIDKKFPKIRDNFQRLFKEAEISKEIADLIDGELRDLFPSENGEYKKICEIHLDYNSKKGRKTRRVYKKNESYDVYKATIDWLTSEGYEVKVKGNNPFAANSAADFLLNKNPNR